MRKIIPVLFVLLLTMVACSSSIDYPLNNTVYTNYKLAGYVDTLKDTLTIWTVDQNNQRDTVFQSKANVDSCLVAMSYTRDQDILIFEVKSLNHQTYLDTVTVSKTNQPHFETVDCPPAYFHTITKVDYTTNALDSIRINKKEVNYDATTPHFYIYFKDLD